MPMHIKSTADQMMKNLDFHRQLSKIKRRDAMVIAACVAGVALVLVITGYVMGKLAQKKSSYNEWEDYDDSNWI